MNLLQEAVDRVDRFIQIYDSEQPAEILADLIHYCKAKGFDFADQLNIAQEYVREEEKVMEEVNERT